MITFCGTYEATPLRLEHRLTYEVLRNGGEALNVPMDVCCLLSQMLRDWNWLWLLLSGKLT